MAATVYLAVAPGGACYVGVTSQQPARRRWRFHLTTARRGTSQCRRLAAAIREHGMTEANFHTLRVCDSLEDAKSWERKLVRDFKPSLNMTRGGDCRPPHSPESKAKLSAAHKGRPGVKGRKHSVETRQLMSAAHKGRKFPNAVSRGPRDTSKAVAASAELRRGKPCPEHAEKMRGRKHSPETLAKMVEAQRARRAREATQ